jgi:hypothetical protein
MLGEVFLAYARLSVEAVECGLRRNADEVAVAFFVLCQDKKMVIVVALRVGTMILFFADVKLAAEDRLNALFPGRLKKMHGAVNVAVIGDGDSLLADAGDAVYELFHVARSVEERVIRVQMEVGKFSHGGSR